jgi:hypothetical protein
MECFDGTMEQILDDLDGGVEEGIGVVLVVVLKADAGFFGAQKTCSHGNAHL